MDILFVFSFFFPPDDLLLEAVINMDLPKLTMSAGDRYIEKLKTSGYTAKQLNTFAIVIQVCTFNYTAVFTIKLPGF